MAPEQHRPADLDALIAELRAKVQERRDAGEYPPGLAEDLSSHFHRLLSQPRTPARPVDLRGPLRTIGQALPLRRDRIPVESQLPAGAALHRVVAKLVGRQTQGVLEQVQSFAGPVSQALDALATAVEDLGREVRDELAAQVSAALERQTAQEQGSGARASDRNGARPLQPWYSSERFEDEFRGGREELLGRYRDVAGRLVGCAPVFEIGSGRGEFLELLAELGVDARGVDLDAELVKVASERGVAVEQGEGLKTLGGMDDASLGGLVVIQVVEHLTPQEVVDLVALAAAKVRSGGRVLVETVNPQSLYVFAHAFWIDPTHIRPVHPAYLTFLFKEAGFSSVELEWRSPPPAGDRLEEVAEGSALSPAVNANTRRLNQLLFAPQDYLVVAVR